MHSYHKLHPGTERERFTLGQEERYFFLEHKGKEMMNNERESEGRRLTAFVW